MGAPRNALQKTDQKTSWEHCKHTFYEVAQRQHLDRYLRKNAHVTKQMNQEDCENDELTRLLGGYSK